MSRTKTEPVRISTELMDKVRERCKRTRQTLSGYVEIAVSEKIKAGEQKEEVPHA